MTAADLCYPQVSGGFRCSYAEGVGFEPTMSFPIPVFKTERYAAVTCKNIDDRTDVDALLP
jgi:hypothetical protein